MDSVLFLSRIGNVYFFNIGILNLEMDCSQQIPICFENNLHFTGMIIVAKDLCFLF